MHRSETCTLLLIRVGETEWDRAGRLTGKTDLPLATGERDALEAAFTDQFATAPFDQLEPRTVLCAPDEASRETAELVAAHVPGKVRVSADLTDQDLGLWEGVLESDLTERCRTSYRSLCDDPSTVTPPGGETWASFETRLFSAISRALSKTRKANDALVLVVRSAAYRAIARLLVSATEGDCADNDSGETTETAKPQLFVVRSGFFADAIRDPRASA